MEERNLRKTMIGTVTSDKMDKTVVVSVETSVRHPMYKKTVKRTYKNPITIRPAQRYVCQRPCLTKD